MAQNITIPYKFNPRSYQLPIFKAIDNGFKRIIQVWHRRAGKEKTDINIVAKKMMERVGVYFYIFPTYTQGRKILWDGMDKDGFKFIDHIPKELIKRINNQEMIIELKNGSILQIIGSDRIDLVVGTNPVGVVFSEYSLQNPKVWDYIRPILAENGGFAIFNATPRGENHFFDLVEFAKGDPSWFVNILTVDDTRAIPQDVLDQERIEYIAKNGDDSVFQQEYYCSFSGSIVGSYYGHLLKEAEERGRICLLPYEPALDVHTAWDLGMSDDTAIWMFQIYGKEIRIIDYYAANGEALSHYVNILKDKGYRYGKHILPHDVMVRELQTGVSRLEYLKSLRIGDVEIAANVSIMDGIEAVRRVLPYTYFDKEKCKEGLAGLRNYHKEYDEMRKSFKNYPEHDRSSHAADSMRYLAIAYTKLTKQRVENRIAVDTRPTRNHLSGELIYPKQSLRGLSQQR